jgi:hypothetical protein
VELHLALTEASVIGRVDDKPGNAFDALYDRHQGAFANAGGEGTRAHPTPAHRNRRSVDSARSMFPDLVVVRTPAEAD